jgi:hypothetical protein
MNRSRMTLFSRADMLFIANETSDRPLACHSAFLRPTPPFSPTFCELSHLLA